MSVQLTADDAAFRQAIENVEQTLRRATQSRVRRQPQWPDSPPKRGHGSDTSVPSAHVPPPRDSGATRRQHYAGYVGPDVTPSESGVAVTFTDGLPRKRRG